MIQRAVNWGWAGLGSKAIRTKGPPHVLLDVFVAVIYPHYELEKL